MLLKKCHQLLEMHNFKTCCATLSYAFVFGNTGVHHLNHSEASLISCHLVEVYWSVFLHIVILHESGPQC